MGHNREAQISGQHSNCHQLLFPQLALFFNDTAQLCIHFFLFTFYLTNYNMRPMKMGYLSFFSECCVPSTRRVSAHRRYSANIHGMNILPNQSVMGGDGSSA